MDHLVELAVINFLKGWSIPESILRGCIHNACKTGSIRICLAHRNALQCLKQGVMMAPHVLDLFVHSADANWIEKTTMGHVATKPVGLWLYSPAASDVPRQSV